MKRFGLRLGTSPATEDRTGPRSDDPGLRFGPPPRFGVPSRFGFLPDLTCLRNPFVSRRAYFTWRRAADKLGE